MLTRIAKLAVAVLVAQAGALLTPNVSRAASARMNCATGNGWCCVLASDCPVSGVYCCMEKGGVPQSSTCGCENPI